MGAFHAYFQIGENVVHLFGNPGGEQEVFAVFILHGEEVAVGIALEQDERPVVITQGIGHLGFLFGADGFLGKVQYLCFSSVEDALYFGYFDVAHDDGFRFVLYHDAAGIVQRGTRVGVDDGFECLVHGCLVILHSAFGQLLELGRYVCGDLADECCKCFIIGFLQGSGVSCTPDVVFAGLYFLNGLSFCGKGNK